MIFQIMRELCISHTEWSIFDSRIFFFFYINLTFITFHTLVFSSNGWEVNQFSVAYAHTLSQCSYTMCVPLCVQLHYAGNTNA